MNTPGGTVQTQTNVDLLQAQNRTTHAVRALAVFVLYSAVSNLVGGVIIGISYGIGLASYEGLGSVTFGLVVGSLVIAVGSGIALGQGLSELGKSRVDSPNLQQTNSYVGEEQIRTRNSDDQTSCQHCSALNAPGKSRCRVCDGLLSN